MNTDIFYYYWLKFLFYSGIIIVFSCLIALTYGELEVNEEQSDIINSEYRHNGPLYETIRLFKLNKRFTKIEYIYVINLMEKSNDIN